MEINCNQCQMQNTNHCHDCVVQVLLRPEPRVSAVVVDLAEERAMRELHRVGLIPTIRMKPKSVPA